MWPSHINKKKKCDRFSNSTSVVNNILCAFQVTDGGTVVKEILGGVDSISKVLTSVSTGSSSSSSSTTDTGGGDVYGEDNGPYEYESYYDESTASPDVDASRRVTITSSSTGSELDLGLGGKIDLEAGTGGTIVTRESGTSLTLSNNKTSVS